SADAALRVDEIVRGPEAVVEGVPDLHVAVDRDRILDDERRHRREHILAVLLEIEFRRMYADDDQARILVVLVPGVDVRQRPPAVGAGGWPESTQPTQSP